MQHTARNRPTKLRILHCFLSLENGLLRCIIDLVTEQARLGYDIGIVCSDTKNDPIIEKKLRQIETLCTLGINRIPMKPRLSLIDFSGIRATRQFAEKIEAKIIHGHGTTGGIYARFAAGKLNRLGRNVAVFYSPHNLTQNLDKIQLPQFIMIALERRLAALTNGIIFESYFDAETFTSKIGELPCQSRIINNGLYEEDFQQREYDPKAADFIFIGDLIKSNGADLLIEALSNITIQTPVKVVLVGTGPEKRALQKQALKNGISEHVQFLNEMPTRETFTKGRCLVIPSRKATSSYPLLEATAAEVPFIATDVGCFSEITHGTTKTLIPPNDVNALKQKMEEFLLDPIPQEVHAELFSEHIATNFRLDRMIDEIMEMYYTHTFYTHI